MRNLTIEFISSANPKHEISICDMDFKEAILNWILEFRPLLPLSSLCYFCLVWFNLLLLWLVAKCEMVNLEVFLRKITQVMVGKNNVIFGGRQIVSLFFWEYLYLEITIIPFPIDLATRTHSLTFENQFKLASYISCVLFASKLIITYWTRYY